MQKIPKLINSKSIYKNEYQEIKVDKVEVENHRFEYVYFVKPNKNGVSILPIDKTGIYLVNQYRYACQEFLWQAPSGMVDKGSTIEETARKELSEEAGLTAEKFTLIGSVFAEPGMSNEEEFIYAATGLKKSAQHLEETELGMEVKHFTFAEIKKMVKNGKIKCGFTLSALELFQNNYLKK